MKRRNLLKTLIGVPIGVVLGRNVTPEPVIPTPPPVPTPIVPPTPPAVYVKLGDNMLRTASSHVYLPWEMKKGGE